MTIRRRFGVMVLVLISALVVAGIAAAAPFQERSQRSSQQTQGCAGTDGLRVGGSGGSSLLGLSDTDLDRELATARAAGMYSIRIDIDWSHIEPVRGVRNWSNTDRVVNAIRANGMCVLGIVAFTPGWAQNPLNLATDSHFRPASNADFAAFASDAARRYRDRISVWEVWNEPNLNFFYRPQPNVEQYAQLLAATYPAIKSANPNAFVLSGGLAPAVDNGTDIAPVTFLRELYRLRANRYFDAFAMHPYTYPYLPNDPSTSSWSAAQQMWQMRDVMIAGGDSAKQIWITEFGAPTGTHPTAVTEDVQAQSYAIVLDAANTHSWIGPVYAYSIRDTGTDLADREQNFGLVRRDFTEKQAYGVVRGAIGVN